MFSQYSRPHASLSNIATQNLDFLYYSTFQNYVTFALYDMVVYMYIIIFTINIYTHTYSAFYLTHTLFGLLH